MIFLSKCQVEKVGSRPGSREREYIISNNGKIQFSYSEAMEKYIISATKFARANELVREQRGVLDDGAP